MKRALFFLLSPAAAVAQPQPAGDLIITNAWIYTADEAHPIGDRGDRIVIDANEKALEGVPVAIVKPVYARKAVVP